MKIANFIAGGLNSPIPNLPGYPELVVKASGAKVFDQDGREYIDAWMGYGALIYGHTPEFLKSSMKKSIEKGWLFSYPTVLERELSEKIHYLIPCAEKIRFATSGSDAVAYAVRAAKSFTGRNRVVKVNSSYHGVHENLVSSVGTISDDLPTSIHFNDTSGLNELLNTAEYACLIVEPILANGGTVPPEKGYLEELRALCTSSGTILIFDEVVTGFRVNLSGAQKEFGVTPDMATFSKAIAGGLPLSVICGKEEIMSNFMPNGEVLFAGTFNGNPMALENSLTLIDELTNNPPYDALNSLRLRITQEISDYAEGLNVKIAIQGYGSMFSIAFDIDSYKQGIQQLIKSARIIKVNTRRKIVRYCSYA